MSDMKSDQRLAALNFDLPDEHVAADRARLIEQFGGSGLPGGIVWSKTLWQASVSAAPHLRRIAELPGGTRRDAISFSGGGLFVDQREPQVLLFAPNRKIPPPLWVRLPKTADAVARVLADYNAPTRPLRRDLPKLVRAFAGHLSNLEVPNPYQNTWQHPGPHEFARHVATSPALETLAWGSAYDDDPWPAEPDRDRRSSSLFNHNMTAQEFGRQAKGSICRITRSTVHSKAHVALEYHESGRIVWQVRYKPSGFAQTVQRINDLLKSAYPEDMPVDAITAMVGFEFLTPDFLHKEIWRREQAGEMSTALYFLDALAAVAHTSLDWIHVFRRYGASPDVTVRSTVMNKALEYNWHFLLEELALAEADEGLQATLAPTVCRCFPTRAVNAFGEPESLWDGTRVR